MAYCTGCGHLLGDAGRYCTNCGRPVAEDPGDTTTRARATVPPGPPPSSPPPSSPPASSPPAAPPPTWTPPPAPRFPLYADELEAPPPPPTRSAPDWPPPPAWAPPTPPPERPRRGVTPFLTGAIIVAAVLLVALVGTLLLLSGGDDEDGTASPSEPAESQSAPPSTEGTDDGADDGTEDDGDGTEDDVPDEPEDIARFAKASAPRTAKPNLDTRGNVVRYNAANMVDGVPTTCWRVPGDGTGLELTFTFDEPVELTEVGLINGYAKRAGRLDWYRGNRRVLAVQWEFDDGTTVDQTLSQTRRLQTLEIDPVTTRTVVLRLEAVSRPGRGPAKRDYTPISDVRLVGTSA